MSSLLNNSITYEQFITFVTQAKDINDLRFAHRRSKNHTNTTNNINTGQSRPYNNNNKLSVAFTLRLGPIEYNKLIKIIYNSFKID